MQLIEALLCDLCLHIFSLSFALGAMLLEDTPVHNKIHQPEGEVQESEGNEARTGNPARTARCYPPTFCATVNVSDR